MHETFNGTLMTSYYFSIIGTRDNPIYEFEFSSFKGSASSNQVPGCSQFSAGVKEILPFIANSSLDLVEDAQFTTLKFSLGKIDSFYGLDVSAFVTQGNIKFILCYERSVGDTQGSSNPLSKYDENSIRQFFMEANELYVKCLLNPFYSVNDAITSPDFDLKLKTGARKYL